MVLLLESVGPVRVVNVVEWEGGVVFLLVAGLCESDGSVVGEFCVPL